MSNDTGVRGKTAAFARTTPANAPSPGMSRWLVLAARAILFAAASLSISGCASNRPLTSDEFHNLQNPPATISTDVERLEPGVTGYIREAEQSGLQQGRLLYPDELELAAKIGVAHPELVRVVVTGTFPVPSDTALAAELKSRIGLGSSSTGGLTLGHAIFVTPKYANSRWLLAHELTHVGQYEERGVDRFAHDYLVQLLLVGYARAPIEQAARDNEHLGRE